MRHPRFWTIGVPLVILIASLPAPWAVDTSAQSAPQTAASAQAAATETRRAFDTKDWYKVKTVGAPAMSPDGKYVAVQVTSVNEAKNSRSNEIWVVSTTPNAGEPARFSAPGFDSTNPRFTPDSTQVVFTSTRPGYSGTQWAVRVDRPGGETPYTSASDGPAAADTGGGEFTGRQGGPAGPTSSQPKDKSFTVYTGTENAAGRGEGRGGRGGQGRGRGADANDPYASMPPMARPPVNAITLPLDPARFDGMQITDMRYKANGRGYVPSTGTRRAAAAPDAVVGAATSFRPMGSHRRRFSSTASTAAAASRSPPQRYTPSQRDCVSRRQVDRLRRRQPAAPRLRVARDSRRDRQARHRR